MSRDLADPYLRKNNSDYLLSDSDQIQKRIFIASVIFYNIFN